MMISLWLTLKMFFYKIAGLEKHLCLEELLYTSTEEHLKFAYEFAQVSKTMNKYERLGLIETMILDGVVENYNKTAASSDIIGYQQISECIINKQRS